MAEERPAEEQTITADTFDDGDSAVSVPLSDSLASLRSSILQHQIENGRTYHSMSSGKYAYPNDSGESERLEIQHNVWLLSLHGALALCPFGNRPAKRVLDIGTGTGCWAIEYADAFPESEVIGVDLSPTQPTLIPPNCTFEVDDVEKDWTWTRPFDFIFSRVMAGSFADYQAYIDKAYKALEPGGYLEMQDIILPYGCDDGTLKEGSPIHRLGHLFIDGSRQFGRPIDQTLAYKSMMEKAGFVDVYERHLKWPLNKWPKDPHFKEIGAWTFANLDSGIEGLTMALLTRAFKWSREETLLYCAEVRKQLKDLQVHAYLPAIVVYGRKPDQPKAADPEPEAESAAQTAPAPAAAT